jgi:serine/threonine protein kinase/tetratricopeptide (TPR) repeat protein
MPHRTPGLGAGGAWDGATIASYPDQPGAPTRPGNAELDDGHHAAGPLEPGEPFGTRYRILRILGAGGMGVVYQAWDEELGVAVALKVIRPEVMADPQSAYDIERRFKRELLLSRQVTHRNVVRIHDLGEMNGIKYITMPFIAGTSLASVLSAKGTLPVGEVLPIARDIAAGLCAAHEAGVVHRDLKPENVMLASDGSAIIMDFGISRSASDAPVRRGKSDSSGPTQNLALDAAMAPGLTMAGTVVGTLDYMAPEQAKAEAIDQRADIYSFGLIVRDMLLGFRKSSGTTAIDDLMARIKAAPPAVRTVDPDVPEPVDHLVSRCLQPDPSARFQTSHDLLAELNRLDDKGQFKPEPRRFTAKHAVAAAVVVLALLTGTWWVSKPAPPVVQPPPMSVLIGDFDNRAGDVAFEGAVEQALATGLEGASFITVYPRRQAQQVAAQLGAGAKINEATARLISRREGIKVVVTGAVEPLGSGYRVTATALDPVREGQTDQPLASATADANNKDGVLKAVGSLAAELRAELGDKTPESERLAAAETFTAGSLEAMRAYVRGQELNRAGKPREALTALEQAVTLDPQFGMAYVQMASSYTNLKMDDRAKEKYEEAFKHSDRMTEREKYRSRGVYFFGVVRNYKEAIKTYEKLVELYPADNTGYANLALAHIYDRNIPKAIEMGRKAIAIYPRDILQRTNYATYSMLGGDFQTAVTEAQRVLKENPKYEWANLTLALSTLAQGDEGGARAAYAQLAGVSTMGASLASLGQADLEMYYGRPKRALEILNAGIARDEKEKDPSSLGLKLVAAAEAYLARGNKSAAAGAAERATRVSDHEAVLVPAAHVLIQVGKADRALELARSLEQMIPPHLRSYARVIKGDVALHERRLPQAIDELQAAETLHDSWIVHTLLGQAYQAAAQYPESVAQWELCVKRRGEAADAFIADTSSMRYLPVAYYWLARAQESLGGGMSGAAENYRKYIEIRNDAEGDPLVGDARKRVSR